VIYVERAVVDGQEAPTKTRAVRTVRQLTPLRADLGDWRAHSGGEASGIVFPTSSGTFWRETDFRNWRRRRFNPAVAAAGRPKTTRPYDLRHSFASLLLAEQTSPIDVAGQMGHNPATLLQTYAHVIEELRGKRVVQAVSEIESARNRVAQTLPESSTSNRSA
jgi:integrase